MYIPKKYGQSKEESCVFCDRRATTMNKQGLNTCLDHKHELFEDIKCTCGSWLELKTGKFGAYFNCINCGNINFKKGMEIRDMTYKKEEKKQVKEKVNFEKNEDKFILDSGKYKNFDYGID